MKMFVTISNNHYQTLPYINKIVLFLGKRTGREREIKKVHGPEREKIKGKKKKKGTQN